MDIQTIAQNLFKKHEGRYFIYDMEGKPYSFLYKGIKESGTIDTVRRDVFNRKIYLYIGSKAFNFREPTYISKDGNDIIFTYATDIDAESEDDLQIQETTEHRFTAL